eukprot:COSAG02_NODE_2363_length_9059_cov_7.474219_13_plen_69_part_00
MGASPVNPNSPRSENARHARTHARTRAKQRMPLYIDLYAAANSGNHHPGQSRAEARPELGQPDAELSD